MCDSSHHFLLCFRFYVLVPLFTNDYRTENRGPFAGKCPCTSSSRRKGFVTHYDGSTRSWSSTRSTWCGYWSTTEVVWGVSSSAWSIDQSLLSLNPSRSCCQGIALWQVLLLLLLLQFDFAALRQEIFSMEKVDQDTSTPLIELKR